MLVLWQDEPVSVKELGGRDESADPHRTLGRLTRSLTEAAHAAP